MSLTPIFAADISENLAKIPLNVTIDRKQFEIFHFVPNCPPLLARQICDLSQGYARLVQLVTERSAQAPLPALPATAPRNPKEARLAFVILMHRADFLMTTSVEAVRCDLSGTLCTYLSLPA